ncbi:hypothetical protein [Hellea balneolensis]|uniref:hypothetical protein n=1 Tax=Hellea balneolensis TaxID=287478 RepID=UPI0003F54085|nr:hypothetical protein [Hellea balneolensis]
MTHFKALLIIALTALSLSACATAPDPEKVCTSEWISKRSDKAISRIEKKAVRSIKPLKKAGEKWAQGKTPNPIQLFMLSNSLKSLEKELKNGQGIKDLKMLSATCNDPKIISNAMDGFLRKQGLPDNIIKFIEGVGIYQQLIAPDPALANRA